MHQGAVSPSGFRQKLLPSSGPRFGILSSSRMKESGGESHGSQRSPVSPRFARPRYSVPWVAAIQKVDPVVRFLGR